MESSVNSASINKSFNPTAIPIFLCVLIEPITEGGFVEENVLRKTIVSNVNGRYM
jgi:hypothetical protein